MKWIDWIARQKYRPSKRNEPADQSAIHRSTIIVQCLFVRVVCGYVCRLRLFTGRFGISDGTVRAKRSIDHQCAPKRQRESESERTTKPWEEREMEGGGWVTTASSDNQRQDMEIVGGAVGR